MSVTPRYGMGCLFIPDARDQNYLMAAKLPQNVTPPPRKVWKTGPVLNQSNKPFCVGFGTEGWLNAEPLMTMDGPAPDVIYAGAQALDQIPGPHEGSTVRAALKYMQQQNRVESYHWATCAEDAVNWLLTMGTVVTGLTWVSGMAHPDSYGRMSLTGPAIGGHCTLLYGADTRNGVVFLRNSWGSGWSRSGNAILYFSDLDKLIKANGEAVGVVECTPVKQAEAA